MSVENKYVDAELEAGKLGNPVNISGAEEQSQVLTFEVDAADDDGSVYRISKSLNPNLIIKSIQINNDAITGGTDYNLGIYETSTDRGDGPIIGGGNQFADALDMSAAAANGSEKNGLANVAIEDLPKKLYELAGDDVNTKKQGYDIAFTAVIVGDGGTITVRMELVQG